MIKIFNETDFKNNFPNHYLKIVSHVLRKIYCSVGMIFIYSEIPIDCVKLTTGRDETFDVLNKTPREISGEKVAPC